MFLGKNAQTYTTFYVVGFGLLVCAPFDSAHCALVCNMTAQLRAALFFAGAVPVLRAPVRVLSVWVSAVVLTQCALVEPVYLLAIPLTPMHVSLLAVAGVADWELCAMWLVFAAQIVRLFTGTLALPHAVVFGVVLLVHVRQTLAVARMVRQSE